MQFYQTNMDTYMNLVNSITSYQYMLILHFAVKLNLKVINILHYQILESTIHGKKHKKGHIKIRKIRCKDQNGMDHIPYQILKTNLNILSKSMKHLLIIF